MGTYTCIAGGGGEGHYVRMCWEVGFHPGVMAAVDVEVRRWCTGRCTIIYISVASCISICIPIHVFKKKGGWVFRTQKSWKIQ